MAGKNSWIDDQINRFGEDFIIRMNPETIQRQAKQRLFRDMVRGNIDYDKHGKYFADSKFLENLIIAAFNELQSNDAVLRALTFYDRYVPGDSIISQCIIRHHALCCIYKSILDRLNAVKYNDYNIGYLTDISMVLRGYRNFI